MGNRGRWMLLVPLALWGGGLAGCQVVVGPRGEPGAGGTSCNTCQHWQQAGSGRPQRGQPAWAQQGEIVQASYAEAPGAAPGEVIEHGPLPPGTVIEHGPLPPGAVIHGPGAGAVLMPPGPIPTELSRVTQPAYRVSPPDILMLDTVRLLPKPPYRLEPLDVVNILAPGAIDKQPIAGKFTIGPDGTVNLGFGYGIVRIGGLTVPEAEAAVRERLAMSLKNPQVSLSLEQFRLQQLIRGQHIVRMDGTIGLGSYGCVYVAGLTLGEVKCAVERHLGKFVHDPEISVDVLAFNSKYYYVIFDGGGYGQQVLPFPYTGYETVLDAIAKAGGLPAVSSKRKIWVARPAPANHHCLQVLPVDWRAITEGGATTTNYQLFPGDRVYVAADCLIATDNWLAKILRPVERVLGITLLGSSVVNSIQGDTDNTGTAFITGF